MPRNFHDMDLVLHSLSALGEEPQIIHIKAVTAQVKETGVWKKLYMKE